MPTLGDCIDCTICVQVCPTGIDIRNGLQYECIACGACIDACDTVMDKMDYPRGLIRYTTQNAIDGKPSRSEEHTSELQSLMRTSYAVFCLNKKKTKTHKKHNNTTTQRSNLKRSIPRH